MMAEQPEVTILIKSWSPGSAPKLWSAEIDPGPLFDGDRAGQTGALRRHIVGAADRDCQPHRAVVRMTAKPISDDRDNASVDHDVPMPPSMERAADPAGELVAPVDRRSLEYLQSPAHRARRRW